MAADSIAPATPPPAPAVTPTQQTETAAPAAPADAPKSPAAPTAPAPSADSSHSPAPAPARHHSITDTTHTPHVASLPAPASERPVAPDSVTPRPQAAAEAPFVPIEIARIGEPAVSRRDDARHLNTWELRGMQTGVPAFTAGIEPSARTRLPGYDSGVLVMLLVVFLFLSYNIGHYSTLLKNFGADLFSVRRRKDVFESHTYSELGLLISIVLMACFSEGILINAALTGMGYPPPPLFGVFGVIGGFTAVAILYYVWQREAYRYTGYLFADRLTARLWLTGFNASQALAGMLLVFPALIVLFNPGAWNVVVPVAASLYIATRLIFISKGFRLFYTNFGSLVYFILYLCSLEITPLIVIWRAVVWISRLWL